jgi:cell division protein FtsI/penicillin-binding protein 2
MRRLAAAAILASLLPTVSGCGTPGASNAAQHYLSAWSAGDLAAAAARTTDPTAAMRALSGFRTSLHVTMLRAHLGAVHTHGSSADAAYTADVALQGIGTWSYAAHLQLAKEGGRWRVRWATTDIHPRYADGTHLALERSLPARAPILDRHRHPIFTEQEVVNVGLEPQRMGVHAATTIATVARVLGVDAPALTRAVAAAKPAQFVPVITLRRAAYEKVKPRIYSLPGTVFTSGIEQLPPTTGFARALLGTVGPATADVLKASGSDYLAGDVLGLSGLQAIYQRRLAGTATAAIVVRRSDGTAVDTLKRFPGAPGSAVTTTLDIATQRAAEAALAGEKLPAALVAVDVHTGDLLAVANTPDATSYDRALSGRYPPGSTFKMVTTYALLGAGVTPTSVVPCPVRVNVGGKNFTNFEGESGGATTFAEDFARSCNTAFINASRRLDRNSLAGAAAALGVGAPWRLPVDAFSGSVPAPKDAVEQAADAIGQGRVEVSPLNLALIAAAITDGTARPPVLVTDPAQRAVPAPRSLDPSRLTTLRALMRRVVTSGTAAGAGLPAATMGKTGTAEFGNDNPPRTHAWFAGARAGVAFAVLVEGGGVGGRVAAPIAARFLRLLG